MRKIRPVVFVLFIVLIAGAGCTIYLVKVLMSEPPPLIPGRAEIPWDAQESADPLGRRGSYNVQEGKLIRKVDPEYSELARQMRWRPPFIRILATIGNSGKVEEAHIVRGHRLCNDAVLQALKQWEYTPTLLEGEPIPVMIQLTLRCGDPYRGKLDPAVALLIDRLRRGAPADSSEQEFVADGMAFLEVSTSGASEQLTGRLETLGFENAGPSGSGVLLVGRLSLSKLDTLLSFPGVSFISPHRR